MYIVDLNEYKEDLDFWFKLEVEDLLGDIDVKVEVSKTDIKNIIQRFVDILTRYLTESNIKFELENDKIIIDYYDKTYIEGLIDDAFWTALRDYAEDLLYEKYNIVIGVD